MEPELYTFSPSGDLCGLHATHSPQTVPLYCLLPKQQPCPSQECHWAWGQCWPIVCDAPWVTHLTVLSSGPGAWSGSQRHVGNRLAPCRWGLRPCARAYTLLKSTSVCTVGSIETQHRGVTMVPSASLVPTRHFNPGHHGCHLSIGFQPIWGSALFNL